MTHRQEFITDVIENYIKNHQEEYKLLLNSIKEKRGKLTNTELASTKDGKMRGTFRFSEGLWNSLDGSIGEPRFLELIGERLWLARRFPHFPLPQTY